MKLDVSVAGNKNFETVAPVTALCKGTSEPQQVTFTAPLLRAGGASCGVEIEKKRPLLGNENVLYLQVAVDNSGLMQLPDEFPARSQYAQTLPRFMCLREQPFVKVYTGTLLRGDGAGIEDPVARPAYTQ